MLTDPKDGQYHSCPTCHRVLRIGERKPSRFDSETLCHSHTCPECGRVWWHRNPRLEAVEAYSLAERNQSVLSPVEADRPRGLAD